MDINYRQLARTHLESAETEMNSKKDYRLKYAALELRMALEGIIYDRAKAYADEFPPEEYAIWQPQKVLATLLEIDPTADKERSLSVGIEEEHDADASKMEFLGTEKVYSLKNLKKHYHQLGHYLHIPSLKQSLSGNDIDFQKLRNSCEIILSFVDEILKSPIFNCTLGRFTSIPCNSCGKIIRKRIPDNQEEIEAKCFGDGCTAIYRITNKNKEDSDLTWSPYGEKIPCANQSCQHEFFLWHTEIKAGTNWLCPKCDGRNTLSLGILFEEK